MSNANENKKTFVDNDAVKRGKDGSPSQPAQKTDKKFQDENLAKKQAREVTPAGKARSK